MFAFIRLALIGFLALSVLYVLLWMYLRSLHREALEREWERGGAVGARDTFVAEGMKLWQKSLHRRLLWLVYIIPGTVISLLVYVINFT